MVKTKVTSNKSPWLAGIETGSEFEIAVSHGEGRFFASDEVIKKLFENGQVATQYVNLEGEPTNEFSLTLMVQALLLKELLLQMEEYLVRWDIQKDMEQCI